MGVVAAVSQAAVYVCTKKLCQNQTSSSSMLILFHISFTSLLFNLAWALVIGDTQIFSSQILLISNRTWLVYLAMVVTGFFAKWLNTIAVKLSNPVLVSFTRSSDIIMAYLIQVKFFHEAVNMFGIGGSLCIITAIGILQLETMFNKLLPDSLKYLF